MGRRKGLYYKTPIHVSRAKYLHPNWWHKYVDNLPDLDPYIRNHWDFGLGLSEKPTCANFSCGRTLTLQESLANQLCIKCQPEIAPQAISASL